MVHRSLLDGQCTPLCPGDLLELPILEKTSRGTEGQTYIAIHHIPGLGLRKPKNGKHSDHPALGQRLISFCS